MAVDVHSVLEVAQRLYSLIGRQARIIAARIIPDGHAGFARLITITEVSIQRANGRDIINLYTIGQTYRLFLETDKAFDALRFDGSGECETDDGVINFSRITVEVL